MNYEEVRNKPFRFSAATSKEEWESINDFFNKHPDLKRGATVRRWILEGIERDKAREGNRGAA